MWGGMEGQPGSRAKGPVGETVLPYSSPGSLGAVVNDPCAGWGHIAGHMVCACVCVCIGCV